MAFGEPVTFLLTDLVGSTELWDEETAAMSDALARHDGLVGAVVAAHGGTVVKTKGEGDSTFSVFDDATSAATAAFVLRRILGREHWPTSRPLVARMAVTTGAAEHRSGDWFGPAVNRAARLRALAPQGAILLSGQTADRVGHIDGGELVRLGAHRLRGLKDPEIVVALIENGGPRPELRAVSVTGDPVPSLPNSTVGRADDIAGALAALDGARLVTLVGAGGSGKTRLAIEVARAALGRVERVSMVELAPVTDDAAVVDLIRSAFAIDEAQGETALVVVDNCEHVVEAVAEVLPRLLAERPGVSVLATSRVPLRLAMESIRTVPPLAGPREQATLSEIAATPAGALFIDRARTADPAFRLTPSDSAALERCLAALDGLPLAIEIAASQVGVIGPAGLASALEARLPAMHSNQRDIDERHRSMAATIDWGVGLLAPEDRDVLLALAVCRGFDLELAEAVAGLSDAAGAVGRLVDSSLVANEGGGRFRLLEPIRQHCEGLAAGEQAAQAHDALAAAMVTRSRRLLRTIYSDPTSRATAALDRVNLEQSLVWLEQTRRPDEVATLLGLAGVVGFSTDQRTGRRWCERLRPMVDLADPAKAAPARIADAMVHEGTPIARVQLEKALADSTAHHRRRTAAVAAFWLARELAIDIPQSSVESAEEAFLVAAAHADAADDVLAGAWCAIWLAGLAMRRGELDSADRFYREAIERARAAGVVHPTPEAIMGLARVLTTRGDLAEAARLADRSVAAGRTINDPWQLLGQLMDRGEILCRAGDLTRAAMDVAEAGALALAIGDDFRIAQALGLGLRVRVALDVHERVDRDAELALRSWVRERQHPGALEVVRGLPQTVDDLDLLVDPVPALTDALRVLLAAMNSEPRPDAVLDRPD